MLFYEGQQVELFEYASYSRRCIFFGTIRCSIVDSFYCSIDCLAFPLFGHRYIETTECIQVFLQDFDRFLLIGHVEEVFEYSNEGKEGRTWMIRVL